MRPNPHSIADWGIATGRLPLDGRESFIGDFAADPVAAVGALLTTPAQRDVERPCPLFSADPNNVDNARRGHVVRRNRAATIAAETQRAVDAAVAQLGHDPRSKAVRKAVRAAMADLQAQQQAARDAAEAERRRLAARSPAQRVIERDWSDPLTEAEQARAFLAPYREEFYDALAAQGDPA